MRMCVEVVLSELFGELIARNVLQQPATRLGESLESIWSESVKGVQYDRSRRDAYCFTLYSTEYDRLAQFHKWTKDQLSQWWQDIDPNHVLDGRPLTYSVRWTIEQRYGDKT